MNPGPLAAIDVRVVHSALRAFACLHNIRSSALSGTAELEAGQEAACGVDELLGGLLDRLDLHAHARTVPDRVASPAPRAPRAWKQQRLRIRTSDTVLNRA
jgi:hypothetical protein